MGKRKNNMKDKLKIKGKDSAKVKPYPVYGECIACDHRSIEPTLPVAHDHYIKSN